MALRQIHSTTSTNPPINPPTAKETLTMNRIQKAFVAALAVIPITMASLTIAGSAPSAPTALSCNGSVSVSPVDSANVTATCASQTTVPPTTTSTTVKVPPTTTSTTVRVPPTTSTLPPTTTTVPPVTTTTLNAGHALIGLYNNGDSASKLGIAKLQVTSDYAYGTNSTTYAVSGAQAAKGTQLLLGVGALTSSQASAIGTELVQGGQPNAIIRPMWEMNNHSWFPAWNENALSKTAFVSEWITIVNGFRSVSGGNFTFDYNLTACSGSNGSGRSNFDSFPGTQYVNYIGIDVYDNNGSVAASQACIVADAQFAQSQGLPMTIPEWGMVSADDPAFVNQIWADSNLNTFAEESLFSASFYSKGSAGYSILNLPNSLAAFKSTFGTL